MKKICGIIMSVLCMAVLFIQPIPSFAANNLSKGEYSVDATLKCYVNAMGGIEFGEPLLTGAKLIVDGSGNESLKLSFTKSQVTIYNITCYTFVDPEPSYVTEDRGVKSGTIGIYKSNGELVTNGVSYTVSKDTAENPKKQQVHYVDSITLPLEKRSETYNLTLYINSNTMGVQFCNENSAATSTTYPAVLTVDWSSLVAESSKTENAATTKNNSNSSSNEKTSAKTEQNNDEHVVSDDGLNIHYAQDDSTEKKDDGIFAYYNKPVLIGVLIFGVVMIVVGAVFIIISAGANRENKKEKSQNEKD